MQDDPKSPAESRNQQADTRFKPGQSGNPVGRQKGSKNRDHALLESFLNDHFRGVVDAVLTQAKSGDMAAARLVLDRVMPARRGRQVDIDLPPADTMQGVLAAHAAVLAALSDGRLTPDEAAVITNTLEARRRMLESADLEQRLVALEEAVAAQESGRAGAVPAAGAGAGQGATP